MHWMKTACTIGLSITIIWYVPIVIAACILAIPLGNETWVTHLFTSRSNHQRDLSIPTAAVGLALDCYFFILPLIAVSKLKMKPRKKLGVALIFATGFLAIIASILSIVDRCVLGGNGDHTWNLVPVLTVTLTETFIGFIIACAWHFSKFLRTYEKSLLRAGSIIATFFCCKYVSSQKEKGEEPKSSEVSDTVDGSKMPREKVKPAPKMHPGLDITTFAGTVPGTVFDENENTEGSIQQTKQDNRLGETHHNGKSPTGVKNDILRIVEEKPR
ncbi:hypothetical protein EAF04_010909 [Stromatinia cepivora]|nr:hypothetical protein EAF04_010909 [Stromatinia cepivora]